MKIVVHGNGMVVAVHLDSQDVADHYPGCLVLTVPDDTSVELGQVWVVDLEAAKVAKLVEINAACDAALAPLSNPYPDREVLSWPQQIAEATALESNPDAAAPLIRQMAAARPSLGDALDARVAELARRIRQNATTWSNLAGPILGRRQALEDAVDAAMAEPEALAAVNAILVVYGSVS